MIPTDRYRFSGTEREMFFVSHPTIPLCFPDLYTFIVPEPYQAAALSPGGQEKLLLEEQYALL